MCPALLKQDHSLPPTCLHFKQSKIFRSSHMTFITEEWDAVYVLHFWRATCSQALFISSQRYICMQSATKRCLIAKASFLASSLYEWSFIRDIDVLSFRLFSLIQKSGGIHDNIIYKKRNRIGNRCRVMLWSCLESCHGRRIVVCLKVCHEILNELSVYLEIAVSHQLRSS